MTTNPPLDDIPEEAAFLAADREADRIEKKVRSAFLLSLRGAKDAIESGPFSVAANYLDGNLAESVVLRTGLGSRLLDAISTAGTKAEVEEDSVVAEMILAGVLLGLAVLAASVAKDQIEEFLASAKDFAANEVEQQARWIEADTAKAVGIAMLLLRGTPFVSEEVSGAIARTFPPEMFHRIVGLNSQQVQGLIRRGRASIFAGGPVTLVQRQIIAEAEVLLQRRAELIARSITERVINIAQQATFERAASLGMIDRNVRRQWITRSDGRVCPRCRGFHLVTAQIDQPFVSVSGEVAWVPDIHSFGRCRMRIVQVAA